MGLQAERVSAGYGRKREVLRDFSCVIGAGEVTAIVGPNGAGKSTLLRVLCGVLPAWSGQVVVRGRRLSSLGAVDRAGSIAYAGQLIPERLSLTVREVVSFGRFAVGEDARALDAALERHALGSLAGERMEHLSVGQQQRVSIARADAQLGESQVERYLLLDEPIASMDPRHAVGTMEALRGRCEQGVGVCVVLHDLTAVSRWSDRVVLLDADGRLVREGSVGDVMCPDVLGGVYGVGMYRADTPHGPVLVPVGSGRGRMESR